MERLPKTSKLHGAISSPRAQRAGQSPLAAHSQVARNQRTRKTESSKGSVLLQSRSAEVFEEIHVTPEGRDVLNELLKELKSGSSWNTVWYLLWECTDSELLILANAVRAKVSTVARKDDKKLFCVSRLIALAAQRRPEVINNRDFKAFLRLFRNESEAVVLVFPRESSKQQFNSYLKVIEEKVGDIIKQLIQKADADIDELYEYLQNAARYCVEDLSNFQLNLDADDLTHQDGMIKLALSHIKDPAQRKLFLSRIGPEHLRELSEAVDIINPDDEALYKDVLAFKKVNDEVRALAPSDLFLEAFVDLFPNFVGHLRKPSGDVRPEQCILSELSAAEESLLPEYQYTIGRRGGDFEARLGLLVSLEESPVGKGEPPLSRALEGVVHQYGDILHQMRLLASKIAKTAERRDEAKGVQIRESYDLLAHDVVELRRSIKAIKDTYSLEKPQQAELRHMKSVLRSIESELARLRT